LIFSLAPPPAVWATYDQGHSRGKDEGHDQKDRTDDADDGEHKDDDQHGGTTGNDHPSMTSIRSAPALYPTESARPTGQPRTVFVLG
jgi:hypothetical protein